MNYETPFKSIRQENTHETEEEDKYIEINLDTQASAEKIYGYVDAQYKASASDSPNLSRSPTLSRLANAIGSGAPNPHSPAAPRSPILSAVNQKIRDPSVQSKETLKKMESCINGNTENKLIKLAEIIDEYLYNPQNKHRTLHKILKNLPLEMQHWLDNEKLLNRQALQTPLISTTPFHSKASQEQEKDDLIFKMRGS